MNILKNIAAAAVLALGATSAAQATYLPAYLTTGNPYNVTLNVQKQSGYDIESATLKLSFADPTNLTWSTRKRFRSSWTTSCSAPSPTSATTRPSASMSCPRCSRTAS